MGERVTVGLDIGTSSVKAVAADDDGNVVARARVPHEVRVPAPEQFEHDAAVAWHDGPRRCARRARRPRRPRGERGGHGAVARGGRRRRCADLARAPLRRRPRPHRRAAERSEGPSTDDASGGFLGFVRWLAQTAPGAHGYWPAQAVANHALCGEAVLDTITAALANPLFDWVGWDAALAADLGITTEQLPRLVPTGWEAGRVGGDGPALGVGLHRRDGRAAGGRGGPAR